MKNISPSSKDNTTNRDSKEESNQNNTPQTNSSTSNTSTPLHELAKAASNPTSRSTQIDKDNDQHLALSLSTIEQLTSIYQFPTLLAHRAVYEAGYYDNVTDACNWILDQGLCDDLGGPIVPKMDCPHIGTHVNFKLVQNQNMDTATIDTTTITTGDDVNNNDNVIALRLNWKRFVKFFRHNGESHCDYFASCCSHEISHSGKVGKLKSEIIPMNNAEKSSSTSTSTCPPGENWLCLECFVVRCSRYVNGHCKEHYEHTKALATNTDDDVGLGHCIAMSLSDLSIWCYECNSYLHHPSLNEIVETLQSIKFAKSDKM